MMILHSMAYVPWRNNGGLTTCAKSSRHDNDTTKNGTMIIISSSRGIGSILRVIDHINNQEAPPSYHRSAPIPFDVECQASRLWT